MQCLRPVYLKRLEMYVSCGSCPACTRRRSREWSDRLMLHYHEMTDKKACHITLTYNKEHLPEKKTLVKRDLQLFFKRVRKYLWEYESDIKIKYYACGEYGPKTARPHYHIILFGLAKSPETQEIVDKCWDLGFNKITAYHSETGHYVAGYIQKKQYGVAQSKKLYADTGRIPPFSLMSKGLGKDYVLKHAEELKKKMMYRINGMLRIIPRYFRKLLDVKKEDIYKIVEPYIDAQLDEYRSTGNEPLSFCELTFDRDNPGSYEDNLAAIHEYEIAVKDGRVHGDHIVTQAFIDFLKEQRNQLAYQLKEKGIQWRQKFETGIPLKEQLLLTQELMVYT